MSPIYKEDGTFWAAYNVCDFTTHKVLANRRLKTLSDLANHINDADSLESACHIIMKSFRENDKDIPFALIYLIDNDNLKSGIQPCTARLISTTFNYKDLHNKNWDIPDNLLETPKTINLIENPDEKYDLFIEVKRPTSKHLFLKCKSWPVHIVVKEDKDIKVLLKDGSQAVLFPIKASYGGELILSSILICGINPNRELDNDYLSFLRSVVTYVSTIITNGNIRENERKQVEMLVNLNHQKLKFFQNISRELLTPLTLVLSPLDEAINSCLQETIMHSHLQIVQRNTHRLLKLVNNLLQFSNIESGQLKAHYCETDIALFTRELASNFNSIAEKLGLDYIIDIPDPDKFKQALENEVYLDHDMFETIVYNLCSNAFKNTWNGQIKVSLYIENERNTIILEVSDTGVGIPEVDLLNIFQRFYRTKSQQSRSYEGTGIGLALVKELITYHGGEISVTSKVGQGTTFRCRFLTGFKHLPKNQVYFNKRNNELNHERHLYTKKQLYLEEGLQWIRSNKLTNKKFILNPESIDDSNNVDIGKISSNMTKKQKHKILLVEDNADMRNYLEELLRNEFEVYCVYNGNDAIIFLTKSIELPDLILSDVMMPIMNGYELLKMLRSNIATRLIPIILLTARADENSGLDYGADDYLVKPFSSRELIARIHTNIKLSQLRNQLISQQCKQEEIKQLLTSISSNILSGLDLKETLSEAVKDIHEILPCDRVFAISYEPSESKNYTIIALSKDSKVLSDTKFEQLEASINQLESSNYEDKGFKIEVGIKAHRSPNSSWSDLEIKLFQQISIQINLVFDYMTLLEEKLVNESRIKFIKAADNIKHMILANMSHELRTPLGAVMSISSSFENEELTVPQKNLNKILLHASNIALSTINNIPNIVNIEEYKSASVNRVFDLLDLFEKAIEIFGERAGNKKIELALNYNSDTLPKYVKGDPERLRLILMNLLANSIKFTKEGEIILKVLLNSSSDESSKDENFIKLLIILSDTGIGINSEVIDNWQSNLKVNELKIIQQQDGTGFGFLACKQLVEINGGEIGVESQLEKGSKFWFTWNVEIVQESYTKKASNYYINSSKILFNRLTNHNLKRIILIHPLKNIRDAITICFKDCFDIDLFDTYNEGIETAIYYKELYNRAPYCMAFINIDENNADEIVKAALKLRKIHDNDLLIIFIVFSNMTGRALLKKLIKKIGGKIASIFKPITPKKLLSHYFQNNIEENIINEEILNNLQRMN
ncbi:hypothetical protein C2G38_2238079 [Gigaspora rosea]|uniref:Histidine kinase-like ATPase n=1 Tax=Gigaspora rosea TaxID=44941 RepID=A0A397W7P7_9GLOM|nr:hypothetical protein C2G38_2238079 [Gigaspora rosea]